MYIKTTFEEWFILDIENIISSEQLSGDRRELSESIGIEAYRKFVEDYGGSHVYVCKAETVSTWILQQWNIQ